MTQILLIIGIVAVAPTLILAIRNIRKANVECNQYKTNSEELAEDKRALERRNAELVAENGRDRAELRKEITTLVHHQLTEKIETLEDRLRIMAGYAFRMPTGPNVRLVNSPIGIFAIEAVTSGYFTNCAIYVYLPLGFEYTPEMADQFRARTGGKFLLDRPRHNDLAGAIITAGLDYEAHLAGRQGYFKDGTCPDLDETAAILASMSYLTPAGALVSA